ncbi:hypothetical protein [Candidatus Nitrosopumilus sp. SW]|nr:hypothetical protein [Candidatus Nitrosopumilus sp. SW]
MQQNMLHTETRPLLPVGSDAKNALPTAMDIAGLSWILKDDD